MEGKGQVIAKKAPDFSLPDHQGTIQTLSTWLESSSVLLAFYPDDFTPVCTKQLCNYRDNMDAFEKFGVKILGISKNDPKSHSAFAEKYGFKFPLLTDIKNKVAGEFGCTSLFMLGAVSRAVFIINQKGIILYQYVEPTILSSRKADELVGILEDLKKNKLI